MILLRNFSFKVSTIILVFFYVVLCTSCTKPGCMGCGLPPIFKEEINECPYAQELIEYMITKHPQKYIVKSNMEGSNFIFFDVLVESKIEVDGETKVLYPARSTYLPPNYPFYPVNIDSRYSEDFIVKLKEYTDKNPPKTEILNIDGIPSPKDGYEYKYKTIGYNFINKTNGHCNVEIFDGSKLTIFSDIKTAVTLNTILSKECLANVDFKVDVVSLPSGGGLNYTNVIAKVRPDSSKKCKDFINGIVDVYEYTPNASENERMKTSDECSDENDLWLHVEFEVIPETKQLARNDLSVFDQPIASITKYRCVKQVNNLEE